MTEAEQRAAVVAEALSWVGTPYHHMGRIKGPKGGVDCATLLAEVFARAGIVEPVPIETYPPDWHLHREDERYLGLVLGRATRVFRPQAGDVALWKIGRAFAHGAIIIEPGWPHIVHAFKAARTVIRDTGDGAFTKAREVRFYSAWSSA